MEEDIRASIKSKLALTFGTSIALHTKVGAVASRLMLLNIAMVGRAARSSVPLGATVALGNDPGRGAERGFPA